MSRTSQIGIFHLIVIVQILQLLALPDTTTELHLYFKIRSFFPLGPDFGNADFLGQITLQRLFQKSGQTDVLGNGPRFGTLYQIRLQKDGDSLFIFLCHTSCFKIKYSLPNNTTGNARHFNLERKKRPLSGSSSDASGFICHFLSPAALAELS